MRNEMKPKPVYVCLLWTMSAFASVTSSPKGDVRCFCNEANCVRTGYMCKSTLSLCYSVVIPSTAAGQSHFRSTHGCADTLPEKTRSACVIGNDVSAADVDAAVSQANNQRLLCCGDDMCNYIDGASVVLSAIATNGSADETSSDLDPERPAIVIDSSRRDLWFRVAVIAVPLIGLFVLVLLVLAAVRMLRSDLRRHQAVRSVDATAAALGPRFVDDKSQFIGCEGFSTDQHFPPAMCWLEIPDKRCYDARTCALHKCVRGSEEYATICSSERPVFVDVESCALLTLGILGKTMPVAAVTSPSSQERSLSAAVV